MFNSKRNSLSLEGSTGNSLKSLKLISLIIIILLLTLITLPPDIGKAFNIKPRRKIPLSPPPISIDTEKQTKPVEAKEKRTEHSKTFKNPDGSIDIIACKKYANDVWNLFRTGYDQLDDQIWNLESQVWKKYYKNYKNWWESKNWEVPVW